MCVDGPSGSGKTVLAARLARALGDPPVLQLDDLYPGWDGLAEAVPLVHDQVVAPLAAGRAARYRRYDWERGGYAEEHDLGTPPLLLVEGVAAGSRPIAAYAVLLVWVSAPGPNASGGGSSATERPTGRTGSAGPARRTPTSRRRTRAAARTCGSTEPRWCHTTRRPSWS